MPRPLCVGAFERDTALFKGANPMLPRAVVVCDASAHSRHEPHVVASIRERERKIRHCRAHITTGCRPLDLGGEYAYVLWAEVFTIRFFCMCTLVRAALTALVRLLLLLIVCRSR